MIEYLKTEGTCKCGLDCPLFVQKVFNFDARIPSKLLPVGSRPESSTSGCKHCVNENSDASNANQSEDIVAKPSSDGILQGVEKKRGNSVQFSSVYLATIYYEVQHKKKLLFHGTLYLRVKASAFSCFLEHSNFW